jgi:hypothetical protein
MLPNTQPNPRNPQPDEELLVTTVVPVVVPVVVIVVSTVLETLVMVEVNVEVKVVVIEVTVVDWQLSEVATTMEAETRELATALNI